MGSAKTHLSCPKWKTPSYLLALTQLHQQRGFCSPHILWLCSSRKDSSKGRGFYPSQPSQGYSPSQWAYPPWQWHYFSPYDPEFPLVTIQAKRYFARWVHNWSGTLLYLNMIPYSCSIHLRPSNTSLYSYRIVSEDIVPVRLSIFFTRSNWVHASDPRIGTDATSRT